MAADPPSENHPAIVELLERHREWLVRHLEGTARGLLRFEAAEDLAQYVHLQALEVEARFRFEGEKEFRGWLAAVARQVVARRNEHWRALKRDGGAVLRISATGIDPAGPRTGPLTLADRREQIALAARALATLLPRDQEILRRVREGADTPSLAAALGLSLEAAERARQRALTRFEKAFRVLRGIDG